MFPSLTFIGETGSGWSPTVLERVAEAKSLMLVRAYQMKAGGFSI
jgi:hypothetical protein